MPSLEARSVDKVYKNSINTEFWHLEPRTTNWKLNSVQCWGCKRIKKPTAVLPLLKHLLGGSQMASLMETSKSLTQ